MMYFSLFTAKTQIFFLLNFFLAFDEQMIIVATQVMENDIRYFCLQLMLVALQYKPV